MYRVWYWVIVDRGDNDGEHVARAPDFADVFAVGQSSQVAVAGVAGAVADRVRAIVDGGGVVPRGRPSATFQADQTREIVRTMISVEVPRSAVALRESLSPTEPMAGRVSWRRVLAPRNMMNHRL